MGEFISARLSQANNLERDTSSLEESDIGIVYDIILDETHSLIKKNILSIADIGSILFREYGNNLQSSDDLPTAMPIDKNFTTIPVVNEKVQIIRNHLGTFYKRIQRDFTPNNSANNTEISSKLNKSKEAVSNSITSYKNVESTKIPNSNINTNAKYDKFGKYFLEDKKIHKLKLYEGDSLIQSRFGQSIRFSAYNNVKNTFSPVIILRNVENELNKSKDYFSTIEEDINRDGSIIAMTSNQYELNFKPGVLNKSGTSNFETKPESFMDYPSKLIGDQILLNSGRIILSAKNAEMLFYSKKNYGFISDGGMSIDNKLGIDINVKDNINIVTNDRDIVMYTGNGSVFIGNNELEPMVKGQKLVDLLQELITAILSQQYLTPSGPTALGPENFNDFISISEKLNNILSKQNQTS
jgi:hypothetical protein